MGKLARRTEAETPKSSINSVSQIITPNKARAMKKDDQNKLVLPNVKKKITRTKNEIETKQSSHRTARVNGGASQLNSFQHSSANISVKNRDASLKLKQSDNYSAANNIQLAPLRSGIPIDKKSLSQYGQFIKANPEDMTNFQRKRSEGEHDHSTKPPLNKLNNKPASYFNRGDRTSKLN